MRKRVLILCDHPLGRAPGQRFRFEQYLDLLREAGIETTVEVFFRPQVWRILYKPGRTWAKIWAVVVGFARRLRILSRASQFDYVFIHLDAAPLGPPLIEWFLFAMGCKVVYDIDDAIFISRTSRANRLAAPLRWRSKVKYVTQNSYRVAACNPFLVQWASQHNDDVVLLPTTIDPVYHRRTRRRSPESLPVIGWTGGHSNLPYLGLVLPALIRLQERYDFVFRVICDVAPECRGLKRYDFRPWRMETEIEDLQTFDIGLMPVPDGLWEKGKVGFKAIQYGALETVSVVSDVASGPEVILHGKTGLLVRNDEIDWYRALEWLLDHQADWDQFGTAAREYILSKYSVPAQAGTYIGLFQ